MTANFLDGVATMQLRRDGTMSVELTDGRIATEPLEDPPFGATSAITHATFHIASWELQLRTVYNHDVYVELPKLGDPAPLMARPTIYLDQNHWSTMMLAIHDPERVSNAAEPAAAPRLVELAHERTVILPMSAAHMSETCKQHDPVQRYLRALTITQLSRGWQLRDPLHLRQLELQTALAARYGAPEVPQPPAVTLEADALYDDRGFDPEPIGEDVPPDFGNLLHMMRCASGNIDTMLDGNFVPMGSNSGWAQGFQKFADFLRENTSGKELKRRRTLAKFVTDLGTELAKAARTVGITPDQTTEWALEHSEHDLPRLPTLGLYREVIHEKLSDPQMRWAENDLVDMMYLTAAAGYCSLVVAERAHTSHIHNSLRRLARPTRVVPNLRTLINALC